MKLRLSRRHTGSSAAEHGEQMLLSLPGHGKLHKTCLIPGCCFALCLCLSWATCSGPLSRIALLMKSQGMMQQDKNAQHAAA